MARIKDLPRVERPREKLQKYGPEKLSDHELLAIILRTGARGQNVVELARKIIKKFSKNEGGFAEANFSELESAFGLGPAKASQIVACFELGRRLLKNKKAALILSAKDVWEEMKDLRGRRKEHLVVFYLDSKNQEVEREIISMGTLTSNLVHPREVFEPAVRCNAAQIIIAHNHPSGEISPSEEDSQITHQLIRAGKIMGVEIVDHVIVTKDGYFSFAKETDLFDSVET